MISRAKFLTNKRLGQNFIHDTGFLKGIVEKLDIKLTDTIVEVGTGQGSLTTVLALCAKQVITYEIDIRLEDILKQKLKDFDNIKCVFQDILTVTQFPPDFILVANIPYYITTPIIMKFIKMEQCRKICILIQDDVAKRIVAPVGTKDYGALSVTVQSMARCRIIKKVPRTLFQPVPNVDSAFVVIEKNGEVPPPNFDGLLKSVFSKRRKKISNSVNLDALLQCGIDPDLRPEQISVNDFVKLSQYLYKTDKTN